MTRTVRTDPGALGSTTVCFSRNATRSHVSDHGSSSELLQQIKSLIMFLENRTSSTALTERRR